MKMGYSAQNTGNSDFRCVFSWKSPLKTGYEALGCYQDESQGASGASEDLKNIKRGNCRIKLGLMEDNLKRIES
jgi:hypothetical protein